MTRMPSSFKHGARWQELQQSLERQLAEETAHRELDARGRIDWLSHQLGLYVGRFTAFAELQRGSITGLSDHVLFYAVEIGSQRLASELRAPGVSPLLLAKWQAYSNSLQSLRQAPSSDSVRSLKLAFSAWQAQLATDRS